MTTQSRWKAELHDSHAYRELAFVVDKTNYLEYTLKSILRKYLAAPSDRAAFVKDILLHSSIIGLGQKFKLLQFICEREQWPKLDPNSFHSVLNIRNAFAHSDTVTQIIKLSPRTNGKSEIAEVFQLVDSISSSGKHKELKRSEALDEFVQHWVAVRDYLHDIDTNYADKPSAKAI